MPFEDDRLRMQRQKDGTYSVQLPAIWVGHGYSTPEEAMKAAELEIKANRSPERQRLIDRRDVLISQRDNLRREIQSAIGQIDAVEIAIGSVGGDGDELIDAGYDMIEAYEYDTRNTRKFGPPINVYVTPWDTNRDGVIVEGEFEICYGWSRYHYPKRVKERGDT